MSIFSTLGVTIHIHLDHFY